MSRRRHRKRFQCGHRGFGRYCHCCADRVAAKHAILMAQQLSRQQWQETFAQDQIELSHLPRAIALKARDILSALQQGTAYWQLGGKRLQPTREIVRIPVTYRYRLLCRQDNDQLVPLKLLSHEDYNRLVGHTQRLLSLLHSRG
jgi:hypothetical protein